MDVILMIHLDYNDINPGYILYKVNEDDLGQARSLALAAKAEWEKGGTDKSIEELIDHEFHAHGITYESLTYDVLSLYMF